ncbi:hypothetical protein PCC8801_2958 [Rippkaea orientalis PCC 8801]|uniref:Uncharacterized protein n=1 Tax=Rippkaea orientalis (strain PCC 8801 / RF-1) TaxID=41431 RepID=B7JWA7_RIPO1|nr:TniB family NTP-binding protein [Rippkaea orientalis]ACK66952.1 hypothetical protein PCC8801_2958 [Rippkaea orientalis PCC 8801]
MTDSSVIDKLAAEFGGFATPSPEIQAEIQRLSRQPYLEYEQVKNCHGWLYELVLSRMTGLLVGESRSGKTVTCKSFEKRYNKIKTGNKKRIKPIVYIQSPQNCGAREFFTKILKALNKPTNGNVSDLRERTLDGLQIHECDQRGCEVHGLELLSRCINCKRLFPIPSKWTEGKCQRCYLQFAKMSRHQKVISTKGSVTFNTKSSYDSKVKI